MRAHLGGNNSDGTAAAAAARMGVCVTPVLVSLLCCTALHGIPLLILGSQRLVIASTDHNDLLFLSCKVLASKVSLQAEKPDQMDMELMQHAYLGNVCILHNVHDSSMTVPDSVHTVITEFGLEQEALP